MRATLIAMAAVAGITFVGMGDISAAPINGGVIDKAAITGALTDQVHCRWYPHRHRNNIPHGWGRGCGGGRGPKAPEKKTT
jgi:hypothetical protein